MLILLFGVCVGVVVLLLLVLILLIWCVLFVGLLLPLQSLFHSKTMFIQQIVNSIIEKPMFFPTTGVLNSAHTKEEEEETQQHTHT